MLSENPRRLAEREKERVVIISHLQALTSADELPLEI